jgi:hypothetical protein
MPFYSFSIAEIYVGGSHSEADWVCLFFAGQNIDLESLLCRHAFPADYTPPLSPDLMVVPSCLLRLQVEQSREELRLLTEDIMNEDKRLTCGSLNGLENTRKTLFQLEKRHLMIYRRWLFEQELATNLTRCFDMIELRGASQDQRAMYSEILRQGIQIQGKLSKTLQHDLETVPGKIRAQHTMVNSTTFL